MKLIFSISLMLLGVFSLSAQDCNCEDGILEADEVDLIFEGKVEKIKETTEDILQVHFIVSHIEKGKGNDRQVIHTFLEEDCGYAFEIGKEYIVHALYNPTKGYCGAAGSHYTTYCTYTMSFEEWDTIFGN